MTSRQLWVLPLLSPLLAALLVGSLNPSPRLSFRVLTWVTPAAPLGLWLGGAALGGAALSGAGTALALRQGQRAALAGRRRVTRRPARTWTPTDLPEQDGWDSLGVEPGGERRATEPRRDWEARAAMSSIPARSPGEPAPTVDVPFRILQRPVSAAAAVDRREPVPVAAPARGSDGWGEATGADDW
ncbi:MAG: hypothetical protein VKO44_08190 [Cyanobacteriota bacterium]|jgi:hypothetical protein|nr:hypothetical protein [Cyanobacteriota bacterium]